jgi:phosphopantetheinyl transferase (holo-ACP synthase)
MSERLVIQHVVTSTVVTYLDRAWFDSAPAMKRGVPRMPRQATHALGSNERSLFDSLNHSESRRLEWLSGRIAAKDAVREYVQAQTGARVLYTDIEIWNTPDGRPVVWFMENAWPIEPPTISISHAGDVAVAVASAPGRRVGVDVEPLTRTTMTPPNFLRAILHSLEDALVPETDAMTWRLRVWCAREAAAKACGVGLGTGLLRTRAILLDERAGRVDVQRDAGDVASPVLQVFTTVARHHVLAVCDLPA